MYSYCVYPHLFLRLKYRNNSKKETVKTLWKGGNRVVWKLVGKATGFVNNRSVEMLNVKVFFSTESLFCSVKCHESCYIFEVIIFGIINSFVFFRIHLEVNSVLPIFSVEFVTILTIAFDSVVERATISKITKSTSFPLLEWLPLKEMSTFKENVSQSFIG